MLKLENMRIYLFATTTGAESGKNVGFAGGIEDEVTDNNINLT